MAGFTLVPGVNQSQALKYTFVMPSCMYVISSMGKCKYMGFKNYEEISEHGVIISSLEDLEKLQSDDN